MAKEKAVRKVKYDGKKVLILWVEGEDGEDKFSLECVDEPLESLKKALSSLAADVISICELPQSYIGGIEVRGVTFSDADGIMGATISALKTLTTTDAPFILNTPHMMSTAANDTAGGKLLPAETVVGVNRVAFEALRYIRGERAQGRLFVAEDSEVEGSFETRDEPATGDGGEVIEPEEVPA